MNRRAKLPGASDLFFRSTADAEGARGSGGPSRRVPRRGSPRVKHDTKITVYLSQQELIALEHARLTLRAEQGLQVDRGRLVREAVAVMLADLETAGGDSVLARRLRADNGAGLDTGGVVDTGEPEETVA
ncbi:MAG: hypothetical protein ACRDQB_02035 [Thermocrispum sp.]